jgi:exonuclease SbcD
MRVLHSSDWHLGRQLEGRARLDEQAQVLDEIYTIARDGRADLVIVAGDVFDTVNPGADAELLFYDTLARLSDGGRRAVLLIAGNHDNPERLTSAAPLATRSGIAMAGRPGRPIVLASARDAQVTWSALAPGVLELTLTPTGERAVIVALPYPSEARLGEALREVLGEEELRSAYSDRVAALFEAGARHFDAGSVHLATSHLFVRGGFESDSERPIQVGGAYTVDPPALPAQAHYVALGHLHRAQAVTGAVNARYSGSPLAYSFSEAGQSKAVFLVETVPGTPKARVEEVALTSGRPLVRWQAWDGYGQALAWAEGGRDPGAWIDLELHVREPLGMEEIQRLRHARPHLVQIRPVIDVPGDLPAPALRSRMAADELFRAFYERLRGVPPRQETLRLFLDLVAAETDADVAVQAQAEAAAALADEEAGA